MNKKEIKTRMKALSKEISNLVGKGKLDEAQEKRTEYDDLENQLKLIDGLVDPDEEEPIEMKNVVTPLVPAGIIDGDDPVNMQHGSVDMSNVHIVEPTGQKKKDLAIHNFATAARQGFKNVMTEGTSADGGYLVPEDIQTIINQYKDASFSLRDYIDKENVKTNKGARTYQTKTTASGLTLVDEGGSIAAMDTPTFERQTYSVKDYAGYIPVTNDLLRDTDQNITNTIAQWIAKNQLVTINKLVLAILQAKTATTLADIKAVKKALNVTLGQAYKPTSHILTNDDGLDYFDNLVDSTGRFLLNPDPTAPATQRLRAGATTVPMVVAPNATLATADSNMPVICGDLMEAVKLFDRQQTEIKASDVAAIGDLNAFEQNLTIFRAIVRMDVVQKDANAWVNGQIASV